MNASVILLLLLLSFFSFVAGYSCARVRFASKAEREVGSANAIKIFG